MSRDIPGMNPGDQGLAEDPMLGVRATSAYLSDEMRNQAYAIREQAMMTGNFTNTMKSASDQLMGLAKDVSKARSAGVGGGSGGPGRPGASSGAGPGTGSGGSGGAPGDNRGPAVNRGPQGPQTDPGGSFSEGEEVEESYSMKTAAQRVAGVAAQAMSSRVSTWDTEPTKKPDGTWAFFERDSNGNPLREKALADTSEASVDAAQEAIAGASSPRNNRLAYGAGVAGRLASGSGVGAALGSGFMRVAGPVAVGAAVVKKGFDVVNDQTEKGKEFRQISGEEAGRFAVKERTSRFGAGISSYLGGAGRERGEEAYMDSLRRGLTGERLGAATEFSKDMYLKQGMDTQTAGQFVEMNAKNSGISLGELAKQIEKVGKAAVGAGRNSEEAIQAFAEMTKAVQSNVSDTSGASEFTSTLSKTMLDNMPTKLSSKENQAAYGSVLNERNIQVYAAKNNMDYKTLSRDIAAGDEKAMGMVVGGMSEYAAEEVCRAGGTDLAGMKAALQEAFPGQKQPPPEDVADFLEANYPEIYPQLIQQIFSAVAGINFPDPAQATDQWVAIVMGAFGDMASGADPKRKGIMGMIDKASGGQKKSPVDKGGFEEAVGSTEGLSKAQKKAKAGEYVRGLGEGKGVFGSGFGMDKNSEGYVDYLTETGDTSAGYEKFLSMDEKDLKSKFGVDNPNDIEIVNSEGDTHNLSEIFKSPELTEEFNSGDVNVKGAGGEMFDLSEITGLDYGSSSSAEGEASKEFNIGLSDEGKRLLKISGPSDAQRSGIPFLAKGSPSRYSYGGG